MATATIDRTTLQHLYLVLLDELPLPTGGPRPAYALVRDLLALMPLSDDDRCRRAELLVGSTGATRLVLGAFVEAGLVEHGGQGIRSWITPKGRWLATVLGHVPDLDGLAGHLAGVGLPHWTPQTAEQPCTQRCWQLPYA